MGKGNDFGKAGQFTQITAIIDLSRFSLAPRFAADLERNGKLFRVLALVIRDLHLHCHVQIRPKADIK